MFDSNSTDNFGMSTANGFYTCIKFPNYESVALCIHIQFVC